MTIITYWNAVRDLRFYEKTTNNYNTQDMVSEFVYLNGHNDDGVDDNVGPEFKSQKFKQNLQITIKWKKYVYVIWIICLILFIFK